MSKIIFPNCIRLFRRIRGKKIKDIALLLNLSPSMVTKIEKGYCKVNKTRLEKIALYLDVPCDDLIVSKDKTDPLIVGVWEKENLKKNR